MGEPPIEREALAQPAPQPLAGPAREAAVQDGEGQAREPAGDAPPQAAEGQRPDRRDQALPQGRVRLAAMAMHADPLAVHGLRFRRDSEAGHRGVGRGVPAVAAAGIGNTASRRRRQADAAAQAGARQRPDRVRLGRRTALPGEADPEDPALPALCGSGRPRSAQTRTAFKGRRIWH
ncbi:hypothetical protein [Paracraurococcus ruber]|uniref:hypothetical protein n=1 Tax=Paracraurococcus ruber TaxID=77675 RepID=UPI001057C383|nr:hypothetical protein [Paracraurococcus ruber]TDG27351.1 hypothetical protein E2C05_23195 [Paracraurococcus ruber]